MLYFQSYIKNILVINNTSLEIQCELEGLTAPTASSAEMWSRLYPPQLQHRMVGLKSVQVIKNFLERQLVIALLITAAVPQDVEQVSGLFLISCPRC